MSKSFDHFNDILEVYMPVSGEGDNAASQIATAVAKIAYRWFNDGDTVSSNWMVPNETTAGGVAQYANWLYENVPESRDMFNDWMERFDHESISNDDYESFLYNMCEVLLNPDLLDGYTTENKMDSIYNSSRYDDDRLPFKPELEDDNF